MARSFLIAGICVTLVCGEWAWAADSTAAGKSNSAAAKAKKAKPIKVDVSKRMERQVRNFAFSGQFIQALARVGTVGDVKFAVDWQALRKVKVMRETRVVVKADKARVEQLLDMALANASIPGKLLGWYIAGNYVCVTTQRLALAKRQQAAVAGVTSSDAFPSIEFNKSALGDVITFFRELTGANFYVNWKALAALNITRDSPVSLKLRNVRLSVALGLVTDQLTTDSDKMNRVYWVIDDGIVRVSTGAALNSRMKTRTYDLGDLMGAGQPSITIGIGTSGTGSSLGVSTEVDEAMKNSIVQIVEDTLDDDMWEPIGKGSVRIVRNQLIITQSLLGFKLMGSALKKR